MLFQHSAREDGGGILEVLADKLIGHFEEVGEEFAVDQLFDRLPHVPRCIVLPQRLRDR